MFWVLPLLWQLASSANILVCVSFPGSHLFMAAKTAEILSKEGHNVTLLSASNETRINMKSGINYTYIVHPEMLLFNSTLNAPWEGIFQNVYKGRSKETWVNLFGYDKATSKIQLAEHMRGIRVFDHPFFEDMLRNWKFDLIVLEMTAALHVQYKMLRMDLVNIPIVTVDPLILTTDGRALQNMPLFLNSEQHIYNDLLNCRDKPTFLERVNWLRSFFKMVYFNKLLTDELAKERSGISLEDVLSMVNIKFTLDHPALSFPYMLAENQKYLGFFTTENYKLKSVPNDMMDFIDGCIRDGTPVVYMSFGTYLPDAVKLPFEQKLFKSVKESKLCYLYKAEDSLRDKFSLPVKKFFMRKWMPQKELLASQKVTFFFSHCGNNGRMEAIYYNVPILCLPLYGDQYLNSLLIRNNSFGVMITKEDILYDTKSDAVMTAINEILQNRAKFASNMEKARDIVTRDPGSGTQVFLYHVTNILKYGNARHLKNNVLLKQSLVEIYNLDILGIFLLVILSVAIFILYCVVRLCKYFYLTWLMVKKQKPE